MTSPRFVSRVTPGPPGFSFVEVLDQAGAKPRRLRRFRFITTNALSRARAFAQAAELLALAPSKYPSP